MREAEQELAREAEDQRKRWRYTIHHDAVRFERDVQVAHKRLRQSIPHSHYYNFVDYGDASGYRSQLIPLRRVLRTEGDCADGKGHSGL
jgi:hypothetical protein